MKSPGGASGTWLVADPPSWSESGPGSRSLSVIRGSAWLAIALVVGRRWKHGVGEGSATFAA